MKHYINKLKRDLFNEDSYYMLMFSLAVTAIIYIFVCIPDIK